MLASSLSSNGLLQPHFYAQQDLTDFVVDMNGWNKDVAPPPRDSMTRGHLPSQQQQQHHHQQQHQHSMHSNLISGLPASSWSEPTHSMTSSVETSGAHFDHGNTSLDSNQSHNISYHNSPPPITDYRSSTVYPYQGQNLSRSFVSSPSLHTSHSSYSTLPLSASQPALYHHQSSTGSEPGSLNMAEEHNSSYNAGHLPLHNNHRMGMQQQHSNQQNQDHIYASSAPGPNSHHYSHSHHVSTSPHLQDYSEFRSQHLLHPFEVKHRRRTTRSQFKVLEATFKENPKPNATTRKSISQQLDMPLRAVQIWFQNRRAKAKAVAKRDSTGQVGGDEEGGGGEEEEVEEGDRHYPRQYNNGGSGSTSLHGRGQSMYGDVDEDGLRYSSSPSSTFRPSMATTTRDGSIGHHTPASASSETFKMPNRPLRIDTEASNRRMTTGAMPSSATFPGNQYYHSPPLSSSGSVGPYSSHLSTSSPSLDGSFITRPTSSSISSMTSYDDRFRRGVVTAPSVLQNEPLQVPYSTMNLYRQSHPSSHHQQQLHLQHHQQQPQSLLDNQLPSTFHSETRRLSLPDNKPGDEETATGMRGNNDLAIPQQHSHHSHHDRQTDDNTPQGNNYWRY